MSSHGVRAPRRGASRPRVAVIGCGIFGATVAIRLGEAGYETLVLERAETILNGASANNQNRVHLGFHYPRDLVTAEQCLRGFERFRTEFSDCIVENFTNAYFIAETGSRTSPEDYLAFCAARGLDYELIEPGAFAVEVQGVSLGILADEPVYDLSIFKRTVLERLARAGVEIRARWGVEAIARTPWGYRLERGDGEILDVDAVINCGYGDINRLTAMLGVPVPERQYEYTVTPIIRWRDRPLGVTIMDGSFCTVLPHGRSGDFLLYHVDHSVVSRETAAFMDRTWLDPARSPAGTLDRTALFERTRDAAAQFIPSLSEARCVGTLQSPRMILADSDDSDTRPSIVQDHGDNYITVFSGKIAHCAWIGDSVLSALRQPVPTS